MPANAAVRIASEHRNYSQSLYELEYTESIRSPSIPVSVWRLVIPLSLIAAALSVFGMLVRKKIPLYLSKTLGRRVKAFERFSRNAIGNTSGR